MTRRAIGVTVAFVLLSLGPIACRTAEQTSSAPVATPARTVKTVPVEAEYGWGAASHTLDGVTVRVHRPVPRADRPGELARVGMRAMTCDVEVTNDSAAEVRIAIAGLVGQRAIVPLSENPASVPAKRVTTVSRVLYLPDTISTTVALYVSATADGRLIPGGWRYVGPVDG